MTFPEGTSNVSHYHDTTSRAAVGVSYNSAAREASIVSESAEEAIAKALAQVGDR